MHSIRSERWPLWSLLALVLNSLVLDVAADNVTNPLSIFYSRPDLFAAPILTILKKEKDLSPGYFFFTPYQADNPGPYIYDNDGNLVWSGFGNSGAAVVHNMQVCRYKGSDHLCMFQGNQMLGYARGHGIIMNDHYSIVKSVQAGGGMAASDLHEFMLTNGGKSALMTLYQQRPYELSRYNVKTSAGWIMDCVFQEVDVETSKVLFEWHSLDHVHPSESYVLPGSSETAGSGLDPTSPWDYFHINSIDKNEDGDYLISARHVSAVFKISGKDGSILWRLNGAKSSFKMLGFENEHAFSHQHDARFIKETETQTVISLYNNGSNGYNSTVPNSTGQIIVINHVKKTATLKKSFGAPGGMLSASQGNMQILPDGHVVMGWGNHAYVSESRADGTPIFWGYIATFGVMVYRIFKFEWTADPVDVPAIWTFAQSGIQSGKTAFYASWNGATMVRKWRFYVSASEDAEWTMLGEVDKRGFETLFVHEGFYKWSMVEAVDASGVGLANSSFARTYVPSAELAPHCNELHCPVTAEAYGLPTDKLAEGEDGAPKEQPAAPAGGWPASVMHASLEEDNRYVNGNSSNALNWNGNNTQGAYGGESMKTGEVQGVSVILDAADSEMSSAAQLAFEILSVGVVCAALFYCMLGRRYPNRLRAIKMSVQQQLQRPKWTVVSQTEV